MQKITPYLWFDNQAEEAMNFYVSLFKDSKILSVSRYEVDAPESPGTVMTATFQLAGQEFMALNGGPYFKFNEAISLFVNCETQAEVDELWEKLSAGGEEQQCGWLKDQLRPVMADRPHRAGRDVGRSGSPESAERHAGDAADAEDRHCRLADARTSRNNLRPVRFGKPDRSRNTRRTAMKAIFTTPVVQEEGMNATGLPCAGRGGRGDGHREEAQGHGEPQRATPTAAPSRPTATCSCCR